MIRIAAAIALLAATATSASLAAGPAYEGTWVDHCASGKATCIFSVERTGKTYRLEWRATDRTGQEEFCTLRATLSTATDKRIKRVFGPALSGLADGGDGTVVITVNGDKATIRTTGAECFAPGGKIAVDGRYDREVVDF